MSVARPWIIGLGVAGLSTVLCGLVYASVQQTVRQSANDPQIQMVEDAVFKMEAGRSPALLTSTTEKINIAQSLSPYIVIYDSAGHPVASTGLLNEKMPNIPAGVFDFVKTHGEDRFTWQPQSDVRVAAVVAKVDGAHPGFILAGRSLREVEARESQLSAFALGAWMLCLLIAAGIAIL